MARSTEITTIKNGSWRILLLIFVLQFVMGYGFVVPSDPFSSTTTRPNNSNINDRSRFIHNWGHHLNDASSYKRSGRGELKMMDYNLENIIYSAQSTASDMATSVVSGGGGGILSSVGALYVAGLFTSFSPCSLGLLPLTMSYISSATGEREDKTALLPTVAYAAGLSSVFCGLGLSVAFVGQSVFGSNDADYGTLIASSIAILMGCQLLNFLNLPLPSFELPIPGSNNNNDGESDSNKNGLFEIFLLGGSSALVASPCATPVLTTLLAYVAAASESGNSITYGALLLLFYTFGYTTPLLLVGATGGQLMANLSSMQEEGTALSIVGRSVTPVTASILIWTGTNGILTSLLGDPSLLALTPVIE